MPAEVWIGHDPIQRADLSACSRSAGSSVLAGRLRMPQTNVYDQILIGGKWVSADDHTYDIINPATEGLAGKAPQASVGQVATAAAAAKDALYGWSRTSRKERSELLRAAADLWVARSNDLIPLVQAETGATIGVTSGAQLPLCSDRLYEYADLALSDWDEPVLPTESAVSELAPPGLLGGLTVRQSVGVVACISPYNFPLSSSAGKLGPALAMGNTVVVKPAPQDPMGVIELVKVLDEVGFPPGVVNIITGSCPELGQALVESLDVDMISFTGSSAVGTKIAQVGGKSLKRLLLELGGKGAALVLEDADLPKVIESIATVWSFHSGQVCTAPTRAIVHRSIYDDVVEGLEQVARSMRTGDPLDRSTVVGPVISSRQRDHVESMILSGEREGGSVVVDGRRPNDLSHGYFVGPTLLADCTNLMTASRSEIFGPVVVVIPFDNDEEGISIVNDTAYGLSNYVFSRDSARALAVALRLRSGNVGINTVGRNNNTPFGGFKRSGIGRMDGKWGMHAYSELQGIAWASA
jgi:phenylacetaldehyde dehydrogenase